MLNHHKFTNLKQNIYNVPRETRLEEALSDPCLSWKTTKLGQSLGLDRKNRGIVTPHGWHDKDPPPPAQRPMVPPSLRLRFRQRWRLHMSEICSIGITDKQQINNQKQQSINLVLLGIELTPADITQIPSMPTNLSYYKTLATCITQNI